MIKLHRNGLNGWTLRGADPIGPPTLSLFRGGTRTRLLLLANGANIGAGGTAIWARMPGTGISLRLHLPCRARHVLWGARRGDYQLAMRTALQITSGHLPAGSECVGVSLTSARYWFWIPVTA